jgi:hypothetical protein
VVLRAPALVREFNEPIEQKLYLLETKTPLDFESVSSAIARIRDPERLRRRLGHAIRYSQRVEAEVGDLGIETLLPQATDDYVGRFLTTWMPDELGHARAHDELLRALDLPVYVSRPIDHVPFHNRIAGVLGNLSTHVYETVSMIYHSIGAINERLAMGAYRQMTAIMHELGERELADTLMNPMRRDEAAHLGYYRTYAKQLRPRLRWWQLALVRGVIVHTYAPVGAGKAHDKAPMGRALHAMQLDPHERGFWAAVEEIADELLAKPGRRLPPFVQTSLQRCVDLARGEDARS